MLCHLLSCLNYIIYQLQPEMTPREAFQFRNSPDLEALPLDEAADCVIAHGIIPYPPGIPLVMPGENIGAAVCLPVSCAFWLVGVRVVYFMPGLNGDFSCFPLGVARLACATLPHVESFPLPQQSRQSPSFTPLAHVCFPGWAVHQVSQISGTVGPGLSGFRDHH